MSMKKMRFTTPTPTNKEAEDRISDLPDELIHHILWFLDVQTAVQTSVLSKRWKPVWTTLPFINFTRYDQQQGEYIRGSTFNYFRHVFSDSSTTEINLFDKFFSNRNHDSDILKLYLSFFFVPPPNLVHKFISYAISRKVQDLNVHIPDFVTDLSTFDSSYLKKLTLSLDFCKVFKLSDCWDLPALTTLHLILPALSPGGISIPESYLMCLPSLRDLFLDRIELPNSLNLPDLVTLYLARCTLPSDVWDFSGLSTLTLDDVEFPKNETKLFPALVNLRNLTWFFGLRLLKADCVINCPQLENLDIYACTSTFCNHSGKFVLVAPKIRKIGCVGLFPITFGLSQLEYVKMKLRDSSGGRKTIPGTKLGNIYYRGFTDMFQVLGSAKILALDLETIEALSSISDSLLNSPPPFYNLKYVKVPQGCKESSMSTNLKCYLLGRSPEATIVTTLPQKNIVHKEAGSVTAWNAVLQKPLKSPLNMLAGPENLNKTVCIGIGVQENMAQNSVVSTGRDTQIGVPVEGTDSDSISSSRKISDFGLWQGHEVKSEFVYLLDLIKIKYPETFENFTRKNKRVSTTKLNMLCTSVNDFIKISLSDMDTEMIAVYRDVFSCLKQFGFNIGWLVSRLKYVEQLQFSHPLLSELHAIECHIEDAKSKLDMQVRIGNTGSELQDLQTLRAAKVRQIQNAFETKGKILVGYVGDGLFSDP